MISTYMTPKHFIIFERVDERAKLPSYKHDDDSGFDLRVIEDLEIYPGETAMARTGLKAMIPAGTEIQVRPRSGLACNTDLWIKNAPGTIDEGYRGEWLVILGNLGSDPIRFKAGDRIAQAVLVPVLRATIIEAQPGTALSVTERGENGIGSTGLAS